MQLNGCAVVVTGGASGLGLATVEMIVSAGGHAVIVDLNDGAGTAAADRLGEQVRFVRADVTNDDDMQRAVDMTVLEYGAVHGLVCAAGIAAAERVLQK